MAEEDVAYFAGEVAPLGLTAHLLNSGYLLTDLVAIG
jgi:hypothetical protein